MIDSEKNNAWDESVNHHLITHAKFNKQKSLKHNSICLFIPLASDDTNAVFGNGREPEAPFRWNNAFTREREMHRNTCVPSQ